MQTVAHHVPACATGHHAGDPFLLAVNNGIIDLRRGELIPGAVAAPGTQRCPVDFDPTARDRRWEEFLVTALGGDCDDLKFLQRFAGYCATGDTHEHLALVLHGPPSSGKTLLAATLVSVLGSYAAPADQGLFQRLMSHSLRLLDKRLVIIDGCDGFGSIGSDRGKQIISGNGIIVDLLGEPSREVIPQCKLLLIANRLHSGLNNDAVARRLRFLRLRRRSNYPNFNLRAHLATPGTRRAILAWIVQGAQHWIQLGLRGDAAARA